MSDRLEDFIIQSREHLGIVEDALLALEKPSATIDAPSRIDCCFRSIHSIKGDAGFLGLTRIHELSHAMETLLGHLHVPVSPRAIEVLLSARDRLTVMVDDPNRSQAHDIGDILSALVDAGTIVDRHPIQIDLRAWNTAHPGGIAAYVRQIAGGARVTNGQIHVEKCELRSGLPKGAVRWTGFVEANKSSAVASPKMSPGHSPGTLPIKQLSVDLTHLSSSNRGLVNLFRELATVAPVRGGRISLPEHNLRVAVPQGSVCWTGECETDLTLSELVRRCGLDVSILPGAISSEFIPHSQAPLEANSKTQEDSAGAIVAQPSATAIAAPAQSTMSASMTNVEKATTLRIQVELLDRMMTLVGELTLVRNQSLLAFAEEEGPQRAILQRLNSVTSELQDVTLRARMQPVGQLFNKFPRMVRDLARQLGKQVELELRGREVELDKSILEQLSDPLMHLIRNSVDHGLEMPEVRQKKGKATTGQLVLTATHEDGQVQIQVRDDGRGIDPQAVRAKALALNLRTEAELDQMSARELFSLILLPGFSTARMVTEVSGRGVGMDVVKTNIEQLEGSLSIDSVVDVGCSITIRLPLTLAIIPCLIVTVNQQRFAVPQRDLEEVVCLHPQLAARIERAFDTEVYRLRGQLLPIVRLSELLARKRPLTPSDKAEILAAHATDDSAARIQYILVLRVAGRRFGLVVDQVRGTQEIVVKPMHPTMKRVGIFAGATIMDDGRVALITNAEGIVEHARLSFEMAVQQDVKAESVRDAAQVHRVLLFEYGPRERFALPLLQIRRIELISRDRIERVGDHEYVTVDGLSTRILRLNHVLDVSAMDVDPPMMSLILPKFVPHPMGVIVSKIVDTESLALDLQEYTDQGEGILGSATVRGQMTLFLELHRLSAMLFGVRSEAKLPSATALPQLKRLLLIDDTAFFREVVKRYLSAEGYEITTAIHGADGLEKLSTGREFDLIVSDIEMPVMDGWEFARQARRRGIKTPMLALTSLSGVQYESKAKDCGYDGYETKLDHDRLVRKVGAMLGLLEASK